jgi:hypothetical protein
MHPEQCFFVDVVKTAFPEYFVGTRVLDIGSLDINGNNRQFFTNCDYTGIDIGAGKNVDVVARGHEYIADEPFDVVISTECFEHDEFWRESCLYSLARQRAGPSMARDALVQRMRRLWVTITAI